jgi:hypothetical protein
MSVRGVYDVTRTNESALKKNKHTAEKLDGVSVSYLCAEMTAVKKQVTGVRACARAVSARTGWHQSSREHERNVEDEPVFQTFTSAPSRFCPKNTRKHTQRKKRKKRNFSPPNE